MSRLIYPGSNKIEGPWLLDKDNLQKFESMINEIVSVFCADSGKKYKAEYILTFSDGRSIIEQSLLNFDINNDIKNALPQRLVVKIYCGNSSIYCTELNFNLNSRMLQAFDYSIRDTVHEESKLIIINKIEDWIVENKPSKILIYWNRVYSFIPYLCVSFITASLVLFAKLTSTTQLYQESLAPQIQGILEHGVDESNFTDALELFLIKEYSYVPSSFQAKSDPRGYFLIIVVCILITIIGFCCPKANISIGAGRKKVKFWRAYVRVITVSIPTLILIPLLVNFISSFL